VQERQKTSATLATYAALIRELDARDKRRIDGGAPLLTATTVGFRSCQRRRLRHAPPSSSPAGCKPWHRPGSLQSDQHKTNVQLCSRTRPDHSSVTATAGRPSRRTTRTHGWPERKIYTGPWLITRYLAGWLATSLLNRQIVYCAVSTQSTRKWQSADLRNATSDKWACLDGR